MKAYTSKLLKWRRDNPVLHTGKLKHYVPQKGVYCYFRYNDSDRVMVVMNKNMDEVELDLDRFSSMLEGYKQATDIISEERQSIDKSLTIPARSTTVFHLSK